jgi:hypothetical protein
MRPVKKSIQSRRSILQLILRSINENHHNPYPRWLDHVLILWVTRSDSTGRNGLMIPVSRYMNPLIRRRHRLCVAVM